MPALDPPSLDPAAIFGEHALTRNARYEYGLTALWALSVLALLGALWLRLPAHRAARLAALRGALVSGALFGGGVFALAWLVGLPFHLAAHWWRRRYEVTDLGYVHARHRHLVDDARRARARLPRRGGARRRRPPPRPPRLARALGCLRRARGGLCARSTRRCSRRASGRSRTRPWRPQIQALGRRAGLEHTEVEVRKARERTRAINAEALGAGPTTRLILWDTLLEPDVGRGEIRFVAAHELTHIARHHPWKGVAWFALLALPGHVAARALR